MANLEFYAQHNMVAFLNKPQGSTDFHQIVDFLNYTHIKYALTENPVIYFSLIHQFWETASSSTSENEEIVITATIDGRVKYVTEASIRRHLKLEDSEGISSLPNTKIFEQLALVGRLLKPYKSTYVALTLTQKQFSNMRRASKGYFRVDVPLFPTMLVQGPILHSDPTILPPPISSPSKVPTPLYDSPLLRGNTPRSEEGRMTINELTVLCILLSKKVKSLESDLKQIKLTYGAIKVKKLEKKVKSHKARRRVRLIVSEDEDDLDDPSKQGRKIAQIDGDEGITLVQMGAQTQGKNEHEVDSDFDFTTVEDISTANAPVTTAGAEISTVSPEDKTAKTSNDSDDITLAKTLIEIKRNAIKPQKGTGVLVEEEPMKVKRRDQGLDQIESDAKLAQRLYEEELAEVDRAQKERQKQEESTIDVLTEEFDEIQARMDVDHELAARLTYEEQEHFTIEEMAKLADGSSKNYKIFSEMLDDFDRQDVIDLHRLITTARRVSTTKEIKTKKKVD
uniref:Xylulose kinase-1 n=1 Tax=Tanacetum cinerariifolium TaxID=118510 RepID=A0A699JBJ2_TANCI|nr:hypothetical protein [Tanacetum cinerariifolium]